MEASDAWQIKSTSNERVASMKAESLPPQDLISSSCRNHRCQSTAHLLLALILGAGWSQKRELAGAPHSTNSPPYEPHTSSWFRNGTPDLKSLLKSSELLAKNCMHRVWQVKRRSIPRNSHGKV